MLGSTFNFVFEDQMERLQDGDRFYYLGRTAGLNFIGQLEQNSFANMIVRNTDIGDGPGDHLPGDIFSVPHFILEIDPALQVTNLISDNMGGVIEQAGGRADPVGDSFLRIPLVIRDNPHTAADESLTNNYLQFTGGDHVVLGGSDGNDTIIGGAGDDTLWGEDGDDDLAGGDGSDIILGGDGDDILTDIGGINNIQGQAGNDAISAGGGESLILAGSGKDFVLQGPDFAETFGGQDDDFINAGTESNVVFGGEGDDWLEGGGGNNLLVGDNGDPFLNSSITGHDVFLPGLGDDDYDAESGDDIMVGGTGIQRFEGTNGFDWATYFKDETGVDADMLLRAFNETPIPPSPATIQDRFAEVEGLSGSSSSDILRGSDAVEADLRNLNNGGDHVLRNFDLIQGLRAGDFAGAYDGTAFFAAGTQEWAGGEMILGGGGSDLIEGRDGDDIIDGDLALGVRLAIYAPGTGPGNGSPIATAFEMTGPLFEVNGNGQPVLDANGDPVPTTVGGFATLNEAVFARAVNPGDIHIVREIIDESNATDFDTAEFGDIRANYTIETDTNGNIGDGDNDGFISVEHTVVGGAATGTDLLRGIERLQFSDQAIILDGNNNAPTGQPLVLDDISRLVDTTPEVGQTLRATAGTVADSDGISSPLVFTWQAETGAGSGQFADIIGLNISGNDGPVTGQTFTVTPDLAGLALRIKATYLDGNGVIETVFSAATEATGGAATQTPTAGPDVLIGTPQADVIDGLGGDDEIFGLADADRLIGNTGDDALGGDAGNDTLEGGSGADLLLGGADDDRLIGGGGSDILDGGAGNDTAVLEGTLAQTTFGFTPEGVLEAVNGTTADSLIDIELIEFSDQTISIDQARALAGLVEGTPAAERINGTAADNIIDGLGGNDTLSGGDGADILFGNLGDDLIVGGAGDDGLLGQDGVDNLRGRAGDDFLAGGAGDDIVIGGDGDDTILWSVGDGRDYVDGRNTAQTVGDTVMIEGDANIAETFTIYSVLDPNVILSGAMNFGGTEIAVTRSVGAGPEEIILELNDIEELIINNRPAPAAGGILRGDNFVVVGDFTNTSLALNTITIDGTRGDDHVDVTGLTSDHRVVFNSGGGTDSFAGARNQDEVNPEAGGSVSDDGNGNMTITSPDGSGVTGAGLSFSANDMAELLNLVNGRPSDLAESHATGTRDLAGAENNPANAAFGAADEPFIRLTPSYLGDFNESLGEFGNYEINPIHSGLDPRDISNALGDQEAGLPKNAEGANAFFTAFGQYFDHGLDFLPKGGNGSIYIGGDDSGAVPPARSVGPADLTRGSIDDHILDGDGNPVEPLHLNKTSPFVDQNQAYGSNALVGQFLREGDGSGDADNPGGLGSHLFSGAPDPSNPALGMLPTLRELILEHWQNNTLFTGVPGGSGADKEMSFREYFSNLPYEVTDRDGTVTTVTGEDLVTEVEESGGSITYMINDAMVPFINGNFMESGFTLVGDANPFINLLDHYVAGDLRANENVTLTSIHTIWARNHNHHVDELMASGFSGSADELFEAAKIVNEAEYQRVVFTEFADTLIGGMRGSGSHAFDDYNPEVDARISHEFAAAVYRVGHSLIGQEITIIDEATGQPMQVPLFDAFLNPTNAPDAFHDYANLPYGPEPGFKQLGVDNIIEGIVTQQAEEVDFNVVDAIRNDLVRINADLFSFNVARGWDVGLGTLNQIRHDLLESNDPYVQEAIDRSGEDLTPYSSWSDFQNRNGLSDTVIGQFMDAYPDLTLAADEIDAFKEINPNINVSIQSDGTGTVKGIDRVDLWVGGLAEEHIRGGMVGSTFWVVLHEQLDRLQEGDRFYYLDRVDDFDFYDRIESQSFADIVARNTGVETLPDDIFSASASQEAGDNAGDDAGAAGDETADDGQDDNSDGTTTDGTDGTATDGTMYDDTATDGGTVGTGDGDGGMAGGSGQSLNLMGDDAANTMVGGTGANTLAGMGGDDVLLAGNSGDVVSGGDGDDEIVGGDGSDVLLGGDGNDMIIARGGDDSIEGGRGRDVVDVGGGDDVIYASFDDGNDVYKGGHGDDTIDLSAITADATIDLAAGRAVSAQTGTDTFDGIENAIGGAGSDTLVANNSVNVLSGGIGGDTFEFRSAEAADGDVITDFFDQGDRIDLSQIAAQHLGEGENFSFLDATSFTANGQVIVYHDGNDTILEGNVNGNNDDTEFSITLSGRSDLEAKDFMS